MMWTLVAWLCILGFVPVGTWLGWHYGRIEGRHEGKCAERERQLERERRKALAKPYAGPEIRSKTGPVIPDLRAQLLTARRMRNRQPVPAADTIAPVIVPEPGMFPPQPGGTGLHTETMPGLTDTGELRVIAERGEEIRKTMGLS